MPNIYQPEFSSIQSSFKDFSLVNSLMYFSLDSDFGWRREMGKVGDGRQIWYSSTLQRFESMRIHTMAYAREYFFSFGRYINENWRAGKWIYSNNKKCMGGGKQGPSSTKWAPPPPRNECHKTHLSIPVSFPFPLPGIWLAKRLSTLIQFKQLKKSTREKIFSNTFSCVIVHSFHSLSHFPSLCVVDIAGFYCHKKLCKLYHCYWFWFAVSRFWWLI